MIDKLYKKWSGVHHTENSCHPVHDSAECQDFAEFYHSEKTENDLEIIKMLETGPVRIENSTYQLKAGESVVIVRNL